MSNVVKLLNPIRQSLLSATYLYTYSQLSTRQPFHGKIELVKTWIRLSNHRRHSLSSNFQFKRKLCYIRDAYFSGSSLYGGVLFGVSNVVGLGYLSLSQQTAYAMDGQDILMADRNIFGYPKEEENTPVLWLLVRKLWLPAFFFVTVLGNWHHPVMLVTKAVLLLISTKPSPLSVYVFVEQLCHQAMRERPYLYLIKSLYANKVEVHDYKLFCLATVEVKSQKLTLVGILGGWWALPLSQKAFSVFWDSVCY